MRFWTKEVIKRNIWKILSMLLLVVIMYVGNLVREFGMFVWYSEGAPNSHQIEWLLPTAIALIGVFMILGAGAKIVMMVFDIWEQLVPKK